MGQDDNHHDKIMMPGRMTMIMSRWRGCQDDEDAKMIMGQYDDDARMMISGSQDDYEDAKMMMGQDDDARMQR